MLAKILVVEDDKSISDLITLHLKKNDFEYLVVHNGEDALSHLDNFMPDFIILDWICLLYTSPSPRDLRASRMPSSA